MVSFQFDFESIANLSVGFVKNVLTSGKDLRKMKMVKEAILISGNSRNSKKEVF